MRDLMYKSIYYNMGIYNSWFNKVVEVLEHGYWINKLNRKIYKIVLTDDNKIRSYECIKFDSEIYKYNMLRLKLI